MKKQNGNVTVALLIVILIILLIVGVGVFYYVIYPQLLGKEKVENALVDKSIQQNMINESNTEQKLNDKVEVVEGIKIDASLANISRNLSVPQILNGGQNSILLNKKIASAVIDKTYSMAETKENLKVVASYKSIVKNNVLVITTIVEYNPWDASGTGKFINNYFYDIKNDKIIESVSEGVKALGYTLEDINKWGAKQYSDFDITSDADGLDIQSYFTIENNNLVMNFKKDI